MPKLPVVSGPRAIRALARLGFVSVRQRGSHVVLKGRGRMVVVPLHAELDRGTLRAILREANVSVDEFVEAIWCKTGSVTSFPFFATSEFHTPGLAVSSWRAG